MLRLATKSLFKSNRFLTVTSKATYIRGYWPEPITQQNLQDFLEDINYFQVPKKLIDIGLVPKPGTQGHSDGTLRSLPSSKDVEPAKVEAEKLDEILENLAHEAEAPPLDYNDIPLQGEHLAKLALSAGIFRDLFGTFKPDREYIHFTPEQAERMDKLVPHHWITDQPKARVKRNPKEIDPVHVFSPMVGISVKFVCETSSEKQEVPADEKTFAHTAYYGNIIPACEALAKPSITLDGRALSGESVEKSINQSQFDNWQPGQVKCVNFGNGSSKYYSVLLVNLDHLHEDAVNLHWGAANMKPASSGEAVSYDEICDLLPVHGIRGFGYSRYVNLVLQHDAQLDLSQSKIKDFSLDSRKFNVISFLERHKAANIVPVGLSWFQTTWDHSSNKIFHDYLNQEMPVYEHVQAQLEKKPEVMYPGRLPFNVYLDHHRSKKSINEQVLLERLKTVDPTDYKDQYVKPKVPPTVFVDEDLPSWMHTVMIKKKNKLGYWRGLRPASATLPLNNNADLDYPMRPLETSKRNPPEYHNLYDGVIKYKKVKDLPYSRPINEQSNVFIEDEHERHMGDIFKMMKEFSPKDSGEKNKKRSTN